MSDLNTRWGPWGTNLHDMGCIIDPQRGLWWETAVVYGRMRGQVIIPLVHTESGVHLQSATPALDFLRWRHQLRWRDIEYADIASVAISDEERFTDIEFVNNDTVPHRYVACVFNRVHGFAAALLDDDRPQLSALDYQIIETANGAPKTGNDGLPSCACLHEDLLQASGLGWWGGSKAVIQGHTARSHQLHAGHRVVYNLPQATDRLWIRCGHQHVDAAGIAVIDETGAIQHAELPSPGSLGWACVSFAQSSQRVVLLFRGNEQANARFVVDSFVCGGDSEPRIRYADKPGTISGEFCGEGIRLTDPALPGWSAHVHSPGRRPIPPPPYGDGCMIRVEHRELDGVNIRRRLGNDCMLPWDVNHSTFKDDGSAAYIGFNLGPFVVDPGQSLSVPLGLACGMGDTQAQAEAIVEAADTHRERGSAAETAWRNSIGGEHIAVGQRLLLAHCNANVSWPVFAGREPTIADTPGKRWG